MGNSYLSKATITINASSSKVWDALTKPKIIKEYLFGTEVTTNWQVGSPITYKGVWEGKPYEDKGKILQFEPEHLLESSYWSAFSGKPDSPDNYQIVRYELFSEGSGTKVTITQDNNDSQEAAKQSEQNWMTVLQGMKKVLEG
jgi:uncharacterized protein YndB with AHSA1/START domain